MAEVAQTFIDNSAAREQQALLRQQKLAEILQAQAYQPADKFSYAGIEASPSGAAALGKGLQSGIAGYLQGRSMKGQDDLIKKTEARESKYGEDLAKALGAAQTPQWTNPDTGAKQGTAGGYEGIAAALQGINNPDVSRTLGPQITMAQIQQQQAAAERARKLEDEKALRMSPTYQAPVAGRDVPLSPEVQAQQIDQARARATAVAQPPSGYTVTPQGLQATSGGPADPTVIAAQEEARKKAAREQASAKPVPAPVMKMEREDRDSINTVETINQNLDHYMSQIDAGKLNLGPINNMTAQAKNAMGMSDENSRNLASFQAGLERLRNDSLRLNNGVQTDGDARRAWNELVANINDKDVVKQRLAEISQLNKRAAALKSQNLESLYDQYPGLKPKTERMDVPASVPALAQQDQEAMAWAKANANDPRSAEILKRLGGM